MITTLRVALPALLLALWAISAPAAQVAVAPGLAVTHAGRALHPGDIALVTVSASSPIAAPEGLAFGRPVRFWASDDATTWQGFVGIALDTAPGAYEMTVQAAVVDDGVPAQGRLALRIEDKPFQTRQLRVSSRFVDPPQAEGERIAREARVLAGLFTQVGTERLWRGAFVAPVPGRSTSSFGRLSVMNGQPRGRHQGADFSARTGTPVLAPNAGRVVLAEDLYFSGNTIVIDHGVGLFSLLAHLSRIDVAAGAVVSTGTPLGQSGATGRVTGPHLHWAVRLGEVSIDPQSLMTAAASLPDSPATVATR